ncbi:hypothetical protein ACTMTF_00210 [Nonomuraea sp. ZG12]|uniref:hypothetical protein n=1 Tax=Nonomuraea sp. ZG12 TaxID=3452207 RepID=UPI003F88E1D5
MTIPDNPREDVAVPHAPVVPSPDSSPSIEADPLTVIDQRTREQLVAAQHAAVAAAAEVACLLQRGLRLKSEPLYDAAFTQTLRTWWEQVAEQIGTHHLHADHALRRVRSWARYYLTGELAATSPGTLFDHALAHASRAAARQFLSDTGEMLAEHTTRLDTAKAPIS